jgi:hypothetical protein
MWKKARASANSNSCVEVRQDLAAIRDSKIPAGPMLSLPRASVAALIARVSGP